MDQYNFLKQLEQIPTPGGDGFRIIKHQNPIADLRTSGGLVLTAATAPAVVAAETNALVVQAAAASTALGSFVFQVPKDYDTVKDELKINCLVNSAGTTDAPTLTTTAYNKRAGAALSAALTVKAVSAAVPSSTVKAAERTIDLSGNGLQPGDVLTINLVTGAHATDAINLYGVDVQYRGSIVFSVFNNRF